MKARMLILSLLLLNCWSTAASQTQPDSFLARLQGSWAGEGKSFGLDARLRMEWEWVLDQRFLRLNLVNEMQSKQGTIQRFSGHAYYQPKGAGQYAATWFDSRGVTFPVSAQLEGESLIASWGSATTEQGRSVYRLVAPNRIEVIDSVKQKDGTWREFARFLATKVD
jgi:hypothetical protein